MIARTASVLLLLATLLAVYNVYGDNSELVRRAETLACDGGACVKLLRAERTPLEQAFTFQTSLVPARTRAVRCARAALLVGSYTCTLSD
jgi:hypothetical protein